MIEDLNLKNINQVLIVMQKNIIIQMNIHAFLFLKDIHMKMYIILLNSISLDNSFKKKIIKYIEKHMIPDG